MSSGMESSELSDLASKLTSDEFAARFPHLFLLFYETVDPVGASSFATQVVSKDQNRKKPTSELRVIPLDKTPTNPNTKQNTNKQTQNNENKQRNPSVSK